MCVDGEVKKSVQLMSDSASVSRLRFYKHAKLNLVTKGSLR